MNNPYYIIWMARAPERARVPLEADGRLKQRREINVLRQRMQAAVEAEDFARAAELRDEIYKLEQGA